MNYTQKLTLSMVVPTIMVAGAGSAVVMGAWWLQGRAQTESAQVVAGYLSVGAGLTALLTTLCVLACIGFTVWIRRTALRELGGDPAVARTALAALADGDLGVLVPPAAEGSVMHSLQRLVTVLTSSMTGIHSATQNISVASQEIAAGNQDLSERTEQAAVNLQRAASNMAQLTSIVRLSADAAHQANQLAACAAEVAARGGSVVGQVVSTMDDINDSSKKIADIIGVIDGIAFQTNILALNAAVEAARAGEQGRGFAVVASEVRSLASRSAEAAREIKSLIGASVEKVESGSRLVRAAGITMDEIVGSVKKVSSMIGEITASTAVQSTDIDEVNTAVGQLDQMTQQNSALVEQSAAAAESLREQAQRLEQAVAMFRTSGSQPLALGRGSTYPRY